MSVVKQKLNLLHSFIDESFEGKDIEQYKVILFINIDAIVIMVYHKTVNKYIAFEKYSFQNVVGFDFVCTFLDELFTTSSILKNAKYHDATIIISNNLSTMVPDAVYEENYKLSYLRFNAPLQGNEHVMVNNIKISGIKNIFALPTCMKSKFDYSFKNIEYLHSSSILINSIILQNKSRDEKQVFLHVQQTCFQIVLVDGKKLLFYNMFNYHSPEDFIYYLLYTFDMLKLDTEKVHVTLLGEIQKNAPLYNIIQKYVRYVNFAARNTNYNYSYQFQNIPPHLYYTIFNHQLN